MSTEQTFSIALIVETYSDITNVDISDVQMNYVCGVPRALIFLGF